MVNSEATFAVFLLQFLVPIAGPLSFGFMEVQLRGCMGSGFTSVTNSHVVLGKFWLSIMELRVIVSHARSLCCLESYQCL